MQAVEGLDEFVDAFDLELGGNGGKVNAELGKSACSVQIVQIQV